MVQTHLADRQDLQGKIRRKRAKHHKQQASLQKDINQYQKLRQRSHDNTCCTYGIRIAFQSFVDL